MIGTSWRHRWSAAQDAVRNITCRIRVKSAWTASRSRSGRKIALSALALLLLLQIADKPVQLIRPPRFLMADSGIRFQVRVLPNKVNRLLRVAVMTTDGGFYAVRSSDEMLEGEAAPIIRQIEWDSLDGGQYMLLAVVYDSSGAVCAREKDDWGGCKVLARDDVPLHVYGPDDSIEPFGP